MKNADLIIFAGAPGSGKSTISQMLFEHFNSVIIDFGRLREPHLDCAWKRASKEEENMAFDNLVFVIRNYLKHGYSSIILNDLHDDKVIKLNKIFSRKKVMIVRLVVSDEVLTQRIKKEPNRGFKNVRAALEFNNHTKARKPLKNEIVIDNSQQTPEQTFKLLLEALG